MRLRLWFGGAGAAAVKLLLHLGSVGVYVIGPLPGVHYPDPDVAPNDTWPPTTSLATDPDLPRPQGLPAGHPEQFSTTPPTPVERELWASLGIDVKRGR